jgi:hypothetical protein
MHFADFCLLGRRPSLVCTQHQPWNEDGGSHILTLGCAAFNELGFPVVNDCRAASVMSISNVDTSSPSAAKADDLFLGYVMVTVPTYERTKACAAQVCPKAERRDRKGGETLKRWAL